MLCQGAWCCSQRTRWAERQRGQLTLEHGVMSCLMFGKFLQPTTGSSFDQTGGVQQPGTSSGPGAAFNKSWLVGVWKMVQWSSIGFCCFNPIWIYLGWFFHFSGLYMTILSTIHRGRTHQPDDSVGPGMTPCTPPTELAGSTTISGRSQATAGPRNYHSSSKGMCYVPIGRDAVPPEMMIS